MAGVFFFDIELFAAFNSKTHFHVNTLSYENTLWVSKSMLIYLQCVFILVSNHHR